ncbi:MAG: SGNH/GDSL hydrolase family protein [Runella slithyformis]|nr:MAG: SGNH/GDSL hydrolase family protein [Runella slithyformis]TAE97778.1 MAG: SGNH/GDSL hydrolase family protein [Runella slithyformis]TAF47776.1 MAG: SGNH/GDSL hydrolase family protein [Runella slithyformis]TAG57907.1 MAG: SGNH/GDSL hydrolase family protein [Runella slithyformis]TAG74452.1 MAG: SGNH/GDSL hydrolase family protein [Runella slithyformis]
MGKLVSSLIRLTLLAFLFVFLFYADKLKIEIKYPYAGLLDNLWVRLAKTALLLLILIELLRSFYYGIIKTPKINKLVANVGTLLIMVVCLLGLLEIIFMYVPQSHEGALSKASQIWFNKYWTPMTPEGYRENPKGDTTGKTKIIFIGDSFTAGHGLKTVEERFSDQLEQKMGTDKVVAYNLGISGSDTRDELKRLQKFGVKPDILVLQYFLNDVAGAAKDGKLTMAELQPYNDLKNPVLGSLVMRYYFPNFIYWQFPHTPPASIVDFVQKSYTDTTILNPHLRDLKQFVDYAKINNAKLYVVMIPFLQNLDNSNRYTKPVEDFFRQNNVPMVRVSEFVGQIPAKERNVGKNDSHASASVNALIADRLHELLKKTVR